jgi:PAS domain S-box-containing protein
LRYEVKTLDNIPRHQEKRVQVHLDSALSGREREILILAAQGLTDHGIANSLGISAATVATYWGRVRIKFGPMSRTELVAVYLNEQSQEALDELRNKVADLISQIQEHIDAEKVVTINRELFRGLLDTAPDAIVVVFDDGAIQFANKQAEHIFGYEPGELLGIDVEALVPFRFNEAHVQSRDQFRADPVRRRVGEHVTTFAKRKDQSEFPMAMALSSSETSEGPLVTCIIRDLTEHLQSKTITKPSE